MNPTWDIVYAVMNRMVLDILMSFCAILSLANSPARLVCDGKETVVVQMKLLADESNFNLDSQSQSSSDFIQARKQDICSLFNIKAPCNNFIL